MRSTLLLSATCIIMLLAKRTGTSSSSGIPTVRLKELKALLGAEEEKGKELLKRLRDGGGRLGSLVVTDLGASVAAAVDSLRSKAPACLEGDPDLPEAVLGDGSTRRTFATEARDFPGCLSGEMAAVADAFDSLEAAVVRVVEAAAGKELRYATGSGEDVVALSDSPHKDHLHVYERRQKPPSVSSHWRHAENFNHPSSSSSDGDENDYLVPFHVDNGLFLLLTHFPEHPLQVRTSDGRNGSVAVEDDSGSVLVLFGRGMTEWLLQDEEEKEVRDQFFPVPHAVPSMNFGALNHRTVYARMKVAPMDAEPLVARKGARGHHGKVKTFGEVFMTREEHWEDSQVCSTDLHFSDSTQSREHFTRAMDVNCAKGEAYCWMGCYPLPEKCPHTDAAVCFSKVTNVTCSTAPGGKPMDPTCKWECKPERPPAAGYKMSDYCNGRMDMLMFGFSRAGDKKNPCIVLFVEAWTLDTRTKFAAGCVGVAALGFTIEALIALRRNLLRRKRLLVNAGARARKSLALLLFGMNLVLGYLAMLVAMTYSVELFCCVVLGLVAGHAVFNVNTAVGDSVDPCCASQNDVAARKRTKKRDFHLRRGRGGAAADAEAAAAAGPDGGGDTLLLVNASSAAHSPVSNGAGGAAGGAAAGAGAAAAGGGGCCGERLKDNESDNANVQSSVLDVKT